MLRSVITLTGVVVVGFIAAVVGTAVHRAEPYWGVAGALALVLSCSVFARSLAGFAGLGLFAVAWVFTVLPLYLFKGPGGSVVILDDTFGRVWLIGGAVMVVAGAFVPPRLLRENARDAA